jgi:hypothetical protein
MKKVIYESFVRCHVLYGITIWGGATKQVLETLTKVILNLVKNWDKEATYTKQVSKK